MSLAIAISDSRLSGYYDYAPVSRCSEVLVANGLKRETT